MREDLSDWYEYQIRLPDGTSFSLADTSGLMYHLDLDGDGHPDLLAHDPDGGWLLVWRRWPDGSVRSQNLRQAAAELLGLEGTPWELVALTFHPQDEMVSIRSAARPVPDPPHPPPVSAAGGRMRREYPAGLLRPAGRRSYPSQ